MIRLFSICALAISAAGCVIVADVDADWDWGGNWVERKQDLGDVRRIDFDAPGTLYITQGKAAKLRLEGNAEALEALKVEQRDGTLLISQAGDGYRWFEIRGKNQEPVYSLQVNNLVEVRHLGRGTVNIGPFTAENVRIDSGGQARTYIASLNARSIEIRASEHAKVHIETLDSDSMALRADEHGDVYVADANVLDADLRADDHGEIWLAGRGDSLDVRLRGHGDVAAEAFKSAIAEVSAADFGRAAVHVSDDVTVDERDHARVTVIGGAAGEAPGD